jgi:hypothetical protein
MDGGPEDAVTAFGRTLHFAYPDGKNQREKI